jgi:hypothetical protein
MSLVFAGFQEEIIFFYKVIFEFFSGKDMGEDVMEISFPPF